MPCLQEAAMRGRNVSRVSLVLASALALSGCFWSGEAPLQGYVEGTYVYVAAESGGRVVERPAMAGTRVQEGELLFALDDSDQKEAVAGAEARLAQARAQLANLMTGKRPEEIAVLEADLARVRSTFANLDEEYRRMVQLRESGIVAQSAVDAAKTARDTAEAQVTAAMRQLEVGKLPARPEEIEAAERNVAAQDAALAQARIQLDRRQIRAPAAGLLEETYFEVGELVATGQPIVSLLPDANRKIRFFVPEERLAGVAPGQRISLACDGCAEGLAAEIAFVATQAEFTPPIIYSKDSREKLVFRVDARPLGEAAALNVGQPLDVRLGGGGG
jgi:HlyD family secretion protein